MAPQQTNGGLRQSLYREMLQVINSGTELPDDAFNDIAMRIFRYQLSANSVYRGYFEASRLSAPRHWKQIPALPSTAFKRAAVRCFPPDAAKTWFQTSGTSEGESGRHYFETLEIYEAAIIPPFKHYLLPDCERMRMEFLTPPPQEMPYSSLVHMMETVRSRFGTIDSRYHMTLAGLDIHSFSRSLQDASAKQQPVFLMGTAFGFAHALEEMAARKIRFNLPFGSRIMETGGFKGRTREIPREKFYPMLSENFGIPQFNIVNEYGMTELSSQYYDRSLRDQSSTLWKAGPLWCKMMVVDPETSEEQPHGVAGLIRVMDLANVGSVIALQTEDVGVAREDGAIKVLGRVGQAPVRGCSLAAEPLLR